MLIDVESFLFHTGTHTKSVQGLDAIEESESTGCSPKVDDEDTEALSSEEAPAVTVESSVAGREQSRHQGAEDTANTMNRRSTYRVVDMQPVIDEFDGIDEYDSTDETDDDGSQRTDKVATCRDAHQTGQHAVERQ